jgi:flagellar basal-body rod protein FlgB
LLGKHLLRRGGKQGAPATGSGISRFPNLGRPWHAACWQAGVLNRIAGQLEHYMDLLAARQKLVASNIANADTPGYKTRDLDFQFEYMSLVKGETPRMMEAEGLRSRNDGNNVSLDREARLLAENALRFSVASQLLRAELRAVQSAIREGRNG